MLCRGLGSSCSRRHDPCLALAKNAQERSCVSAHPCGRDTARHRGRCAAGNRSRAGLGPDKERARGPGCDAAGTPFAGASHSSQAADSSSQRRGPCTPHDRVSTVDPWCSAQRGISCPPSFRWALLRWSQIGQRRLPPRLCVRIVRDGRSRAVWVPKTRPGMLSRRFARRDRISRGCRPSAPSALERDQ
jgi:hypothetical protein